MAKISRQRSVERLNRILERQAQQEWGADYRPAIQASVQEAPRISRPVQLRCDKLGRRLHLLSQPEFSAALLALHHPGLFDLHEQKLLSPLPCPHPLAGCESGCVSLPSIKGTLSAAQRLDALEKHPRIYIPDGEAGDWVPFPLVGDLLLFLRDKDGPYCVNWNIKLAEDDYLHRLQTLPGRTRRKFDPDAEFRHRVEEKYYEDVGIPTVRVTQTQLDTGLINNLREIFPWQNRVAEVIKRNEKIALIEEFRSYVGKNKILIDVMRESAGLLRVSIEEIKIIFYQAVWQRDLSVDLYRPLLMDKPLRGMKRDPLTEYASWFRRSA